MSVETIADGRYRVERVLGDGAMAKVLLAHDAELGREVAVKLLDEGLAADPSFRARFAREARIAAGLSHPNIVTVFDVGEADGRPFIVMELVPGRTLEERLRRDGALRRGRRARDRAPGVRRARARARERPRASRPEARKPDRARRRHGQDRGLRHRARRRGNGAHRGGHGRRDGGVPRSRAGRGGHGDAGNRPLRARRRALRAADRDASRGRSTRSRSSRAGARPYRPSFPPDTPPGLRAAIERSLLPEPTDRPSSAAEFARLLDDARPRRGRDASSSRAQHRAAAAQAHVRSRRSWRSPRASCCSRSPRSGSRSALDDDSPNRPTAPAQVQPIPDGATPSEDARGLADWLRENAR